MRRTSNSLILVQLIRDKFARERATKGCELASGCTSATGLSRSRWLKR